MMMKSKKKRLTALVKLCTNIKRCEDTNQHYDEDEMDEDKID